MNREDNENIFLDNTIYHQFNSISKFELISNKIEDEFEILERKQDDRYQFDQKDNFEFEEDKLSISPLFLEKKRKSFNDFEFSIESDFKRQANHDSRKASHCHSTTTTFPIINEKDNEDYFSAEYSLQKERQLLDCNRKTSHYLLPTTSPYTHLLQPDLDFNSKVFESFNLGSCPIKEVNADDLAPKRKNTLSFNISNRGNTIKKRCENPINSIIKLIEKEQSNNMNEENNILNLIKNSSEYEDLAPNKNQAEGGETQNIIKKPLFQAKKLSTAELRIISKRNCCSCVKSHCLKLYCECFKNGAYCSNCTCPNCLNRLGYEALREKSISFLKVKNKLAFKSVISLSPSNTEKHIKGCKCKNSSCQKNYCECYQNGLKCSESCKCMNCLNGSCDAKKEDFLIGFSQEEKFITSTQEYLN